MLDTQPHPCSARRPDPSVPGARVSELLRSIPPRRAMAAVGALAVIAAAVLLAGAVWPLPHPPDTIRTATSQFEITTTIERPTVGVGDVQVVLTRPSGRPAHADWVTIQPRQAGRQSAPVDAAPLGAGVFRANSVPLAAPGLAQLVVSIGSPAGTDQAIIPITVAGR